MFYWIEKVETVGLDLFTVMSSRGGERHKKILTYVFEEHTLGSVEYYSNQL